MNSATATPLRHIDDLIQSLSEAIESKEEFEYAITKICLLLMRKIDLRHFDVHQIGFKLSDIDSEITQSFVDTHRGHVLYSSEHCDTCQIFRIRYLDRLIEKGAHVP